MTWTYRDYEWIVAEYPWMETSVSVALVRDASVDAVLDAVTVSDEGSSIGLQAVNARDVELVGVAALDASWTLAISSTAWSIEDVPSLSVGREVVYFRGVLAHYSFSIWDNGHCVSSCDPLLRCGNGPDGSVPGQLRTLMHQAGLPTDDTDADNGTDGRMSDGKFHIIDGSFAMAANQIAAAIPREFLQSTTFEVGSVRY